MHALLETYSDEQLEIIGHFLPTPRRRPLLL